MARHFVCFAILLMSFTIHVSATNASSAPSVTTENIPIEQTLQQYFVIPPDSLNIDDVSQALQDQGYIVNAKTFTQKWNLTKNKSKLQVRPGAYLLPKNSSVSRVISALRRTPSMKWVTLPPGLRKEEFADILATALGWSASEKSRWVTTYTALRYDYREGVFWPDTYLIPVSEKPINVAKRITSKFDEKFVPYLVQFNARNIPWTKGLSLASLVQREAASTDEMPLIAGILYNRIDKGIPLGIDATIQYIRGNKGSGWWAPLTRDDLKLKQSDSSFNTYKNKGTPPRPIASPGREAIEAVLNPAPTECLYYIHDRDKNLHCTTNYDDHQKAIKEFLTE